MEAIQNTTMMLLALAGLCGAAILAALATMTLIYVVRGFFEKKG